MTAVYKRDLPQNCSVILPRELSDDGGRYTHISGASHLSWQSLVTLTGD